MICKAAAKARAARGQEWQSQTYNKNTGIFITIADFVLVEDKHPKGKDAKLHPP